MGASAIPPMQLESLSFTRVQQIVPVVQEPLPETITCSNSGCRNPDGRVLPRKWFVGDSRGRQTTFRTCSHCRAKDSQKKRQGRATSHANKHRIQDLENALATLTLENHQLKQENLALNSSRIGMGTIEDHIDSMMLTDVDQFTELLDDNGPCSKRKRECNPLVSNIDQLQLQPQASPSVLSNCFDNRGAEMNVGSGFTELMHYTSIGDADMVLRLIDQGHDLMAKRDNGCMALHLAVKYRQAFIVPMLLSFNDAMHNVVDSVTSDDLHILTGIRQTWVDITPLHLASLSGDVKIAQLLLDVGAVPSRTISTADGTHTQVAPLHIAASLGHVDLCILLLERGADVKACMSLPCRSGGMASPGAYNVHRMAVHLAQGVTHQVLENWARLATEHRNYQVEESWLYTKLPAWNMPNHNQFPLRFRKQAVALVLCNKKTLKEAKDDVYPLMIQMMDKHNQEFIFGKTGSAW